MSRSSCLCSLLVTEIGSCFASRHDGSVESSSSAPFPWSGKRQAFNMAFAGVEAAVESVLCLSPPEIFDFSARRGRNSATVAPKLRLDCSYSLSRTLGFAELLQDACRYSTGKRKSRRES